MWLRTANVAAMMWLLFAITPGVLAVDTSSESLLDLMDMPGFDVSAPGELHFNSRGIQDLDGANRLTHIQTLQLSDNRIKSVESGDFPEPTSTAWLLLGALALVKVAKIGGLEAATPIGGYDLNPPHKSRCTHSLAASVFLQSLRDPGPTQRHVANLLGICSGHLGTKAKA